MSSVLESGNARFLVVNDRGILTAPPQSEVAAVDTMSRAGAEAFARRMARYREANPGETLIDTDTNSANNRDLRLTELLGITDLATYDPEELWAQHRWSPALEVPLGTLYRDGAPTGTPYVANIATGDTGGDGPHGALAGQSGSGKSIHLENFVLSLCAWHPPEKVNIMIIDFKGEASFLGYSCLPHVVGMVNDTGDPEILERLSATSLGEIDRRKRLLAAEQKRLGIGLPDVGKYLQFRNLKNDDGTPKYDLKPLPILVILIDEASIFHKHYGQEFTNVFNYIVKQGRSVGVWIQIASQELGFLQQQPELWGEMNFKSSLVVDKASTSHNTIGDESAWKDQVIKHTKNYEHGGHIFFKFAGKDVVHLRSANNLLEYKKSGTARATTDIKAPIEPTPYGLANNWEATPVDGDTNRDATAGPSAGAADGKIRTENSEISLLLDKLAVPTSVELHNMWTPPLRKTVTFAQLNAHRALLPSNGPDPDLVFPLGIVDHPWKHIQTVLSTDFTTNAGNVVIAGTAKSGRTTALATMIVGSAFRFAPRSVSWLIVDQGGRLGMVRPLPNVAGYARNGDAGMRDRIFSEAQRIITLRSRLFAVHQLNSTREYLDWRQQHPQQADPYQRLFIALDGWPSLKNQLSGEDNAAAGGQAAGWVGALASMITNGPDLGVHFVITTDNSASDLPAVAQKAVSPIYLRGAENMTDVGPTGKQILKDYPLSQPGLTLEPSTSNGKDKYKVLRARIAVPIIDDVPEPDAKEIETLTARDYSTAIADVCRDISAAATADQRIPALQPLPTVLNFTEIWNPWQRAQAAKPALPGRPQRNIELPLGINSVDMTISGIPWSADPLDVCPHTLILGRPQSGRTATLTTLVMGIMGSFAPHEAKIIVLDERGTLTRLRRLLAKEHYLAAYADREKTGPVLNALLEETRRRIPTDLDLDPTEELHQTFFDGPELFLIVDNIEAYKNGQGSSPQAARALAEIIRIRQRVGIHVFATSTHDAFIADSPKLADLSPIAALEEVRTHLISLSAANRMPIRGVRTTDFVIPGRAYLVSDRVPPAADGKPPIIQIAHATTDNGPR